MNEKVLDLLFLGHLTVDGIKPLSRVEWDLNNEEVKFLSSLGLSTKRVSRKTLNGSTVVHVVFGREEEILEEYFQMFNEEPLSKTPEITEAEGEFFGYPKCCVKSFIDTKGEHIPNGLVNEEQSILYHWACPGCLETPKLLPTYRKIWQQIRNRGARTTPSS